MKIQNFDIPDEKVIFAFIATDRLEDGENYVIYGRGKQYTVDQCMDAVYTFLKTHYERKNLYELEVLEIFFSAIDSLLDKHPQILNQLKRKV